MNLIIKFEYEIDSIFEKVYSLNESIISIERKSLIQGFEDGLKEGLGSWLGSAFGKTKNFFKSIPDKAKDWYQKGKNYATQAWNWIKDLANKITEGVKTGFNNAINWCTTNFKKFTELVSNSYNTAIEGIKSAWQKLSGKISEFSDWCVDMWNKIVENVKILVNKTKEKLISLGSKISDWVNSSWDKIKEYSEKAKNSTIEAFKKLSEKVSNGLKSGLKKAGEISAVVLLICAWPFTKLIELVKKIPSLWQKLVTIISNYIKSEIEDFKTAYGEEMQRYKQSKTNKTINQSTDTDRPNVDLNLPEDEDMSDDEAARSLEELKKKYSAKYENIKNFSQHQLKSNKIKRFRNF